ncbi:MAG: ligase-associated DNA damage response DEXH box helicase [Phycisphaerales bacterium]
MIERLDTWFDSRGWKPFDFQREAWRAYLEGRDGLIHAPTGMGKTLAAWLGAVAEGLEEQEHSSTSAVTAPIRVLWVTPMRALANDTVEALVEPVRGLELNWSVEKRTGDTSGSRKSKQRKRLPTALVTTPESLSILLSYPESQSLFSTLRLIVVDEWHELLGTKRGVQAELGFARLRQWNPEVRTWGLSATLGNIEEAAQCLVGRRESRPAPTLVRGLAPKRVEIETLIPDDIERFPWAGHLGARQLDGVLRHLDRGGVTLLFTNTRSQAELWFRNILRKRPEWIGEIALHHGSLDFDLRQQVESMLRIGSSAYGRVRCVVCTSSLDLGVDFSPVDQVIQVGSPKGVARLAQRAGRSGHQPGAVSRIIGVPTHAFELVEFAAARRALDAGELESRRPLDKPLDLLAQHVVTIGAGGGFEESQLFAEVRSTWAYRDLSADEWRWTIDFANRGGPALRAYPDYSRIAERDGRWRVSSPMIARRHRLGIGSITSDAAIAVKYTKSHRSLGTIEESFVSKLRPGDRFVFAGRTLELVRMRNMTAEVERAKSVSGAVPRWNGGKMPLSTQLANSVLREIDRARRGESDDPEMIAALPLLRLQEERSRLPRPDELLIEVTRTRAGHHVFIFPFAGRLAHEGLGALISYRLSQVRPSSISAVVNDYGIELLSDEEFTLDAEDWRETLRVDDLVNDLLAALNATELARRQFRSVARIAGLILPSYPGQARTMKGLQASSDMFYDVLSQFDAENLLLEQARREVLESQLEVRRLRETLEETRTWSIVIERPDRLTPLAFPLWAESLRATHVSSESWTDRVQKMMAELERDALPPNNRSRNRREGRRLVTEDTGDG